MNIPIITYHSIDTSGSVISTAPEVFRRQMTFLSDGGFRTLTLAKLAGCINDRTLPPERSVVLTFDDGFRNFYTEAFPVLSEYDFDATVFLVTGYCGTRNDWPGNSAAIPRSDLLSWNDVRELAKHGIEFGSHTETHPDLTYLTEARIASEMVESKSRIENEVGREVTTFAYPFGKLNAAAKQLASANFEAACSTDLGKVTARCDRYSLCRLDAYYLSNQRLFEGHESSVFDNYIRVRKAMRAVKRSLLRT